MISPSCCPLRPHEPKRPDPPPRSRPPNSYTTSGDTTPALRSCGLPSHQQRHHPPCQGPESPGRGRHRQRHPARRPRSNCGCCRCAPASWERLAPRAPHAPCFWPGSARRRPACAPAARGSSGAPMRLVALEIDDQPLDLLGQLIGVAHRPPRTVAKGISSFGLVAVADLRSRSWREIPNSRHTSLMLSPSSRRATKRSRSSITEHSLHGINTSPLQGGGVTHVSGTKRHLISRASVTGRASAGRPGLTPEASAVVSPDVV